MNHGFIHINNRFNLVDLDNNSKLFLEKGERQ